jgi:hypothetical protein
MRKYNYVFVIQGYYCHGWEDETEEDTRKEARQQLRDYRENMPEYPHRMIQRRVLCVPI